MASWDPDYRRISDWQSQALVEFKENPASVEGMRRHYRVNPVDFIEHWCTTFDPRNVGSERPSRMPFVLFDRQKEMIAYLMQLIQHQEDGLIEKARDLGATWVSCAFSVYLFLFHEGSAIGWGSRKEQLVDRIGDPDSIFEKMRMILRGVPSVFLPAGFGEHSMSYMKITNKENDSTITGESGDNIGRGGRSLIYFVDEAAHLERPEKVESALGDNTNVRIDISSVNGIGNVFHRKREAGEEWSGEVIKGKTNVFVMDWRDNPLKSQAWYDARRSKAVESGLLHVFEQEVNRNYAASVEGILIPADWVNSAIDAHLKLGFDDDGGYVAGLDVADEGRDTNAQALRKGIVLRGVTEWSERDTGATARRSVEMLEGKTVSVQYDCIGVGAGVKSETNRLNDEGIMPKGLTYTPWNAGAGVLDPDEHVIKGDRESAKNKDFYTNLKAQAGWQLRLRFERTHKAVTEGVKYDSDDLISIDSTIPLLRKLQKELSQSTVGRGAKLKLLINKTPEGTNSPNLADAVAMCYLPMPESGPARTSSPASFY